MTKTLELSAVPARTGASRLRRCARCAVVWSLAFLPLVSATAQEAAPAPADAATTPAPAEAVSPPMIPENIATFGGDVDWLFDLILWITLVTMVIVLGLLAIFMVKYRYKEGRKAHYTHGSTALEVTWTTATAVLLIFIAFVQKSTWENIKQEFPDPSGAEDVFVGRVFGEQFGWYFVYPGTDGKFEFDDVKQRFPGFNDVGLADPQKDKVMTTLYVPVNAKVLLQIKSLGKYDQSTKQEIVPVLHSFFAPNLRVKQDLVPYHPGYVWFEATKTGKYEIACAELCGLGHYQMRADLIVATDEELAQHLGYNWREHRATFAGVDGKSAPAEEPAAGD